MNTWATNFFLITPGWQCQMEQEFERKIVFAIIRRCRTIYNKDGVISLIEDDKKKVTNTTVK